MKAAAKERARESGGGGGPMPGATAAGDAASLPTPPLGVSGSSSSSTAADSLTVTSGASSQGGGRGRRASWRNSKMGVLSENEMAVFCDVWAQARQRHMSLQDACAVGEDREALLLRFLRANQFNATKTLQVGDAREQISPSGTQAGGVVVIIMRARGDEEEGPVESKGG